MADFTRRQDVRRLLLVGENQITTDAIIQLLQTSQFKQTQLVIADPLQDTFESYQDNTDLILLDTTSFGARTSEAIAAIIQALPQQPLILLCSAQDTRLLQTLIQSGAQNLLLTETLNPDTLSQALHQAVEPIQRRDRLQLQIEELSAKVQRLEHTLDNTLLTVNQLCQHTSVLEGILSAIPDAIVFADTTRRVAKVNPAFSQIFDYPPEAVLGQTTEQLYESPTGYRVQGQKRYNLRNDSHISVYEERYRRQGGGGFVGETIGTAVKDQAGRTLGFLGIIRDVTHRKATELALQRSETINRALLRAIPDKLVWMKHNGTYLNVKGQSITGNPAFSEATVHDYLPTPLAQQKLHYAQRALQTGEVQEYERRISCHGQLCDEQACHGQTCHEEVRIVPCDEDSVLVIVRDITARKQAAIALQASEQRYRDLYRSTPVMLHSIDAQGYLVEVSDYWRQKLGYTRQEVIGRKSTEFLTAESQRYAQDVVLPEYFKTGTCADISYQIVTKTHEVIDVLLSATAERDAAGNVIRSLAVMVDVTARNRALAALKASEARFQAFMDNSPALAFIKDASSGQFTYINKPFEQFFQISAGNILGKTDFDLFPPDVAQQNRQHDRQAKQQGQPLQLIESVPDRAGNPQDWLVFKFPFQDIDRNTIVGGVAINISEQKRLERQLHAEKELAQVTLRSIGDAVITTDAQGFVNYLNPVAEALTGWTQQAAQGCPLSEVFVILNEYTRKPVENPVDQVLREGMIVGLANHTILIARDGTERGIDDSAAPIHNGKGEIIGTVLVFHDVTEARQLSHQLTWQATHDELTQLINRREFENQLSDLLQASQEASVVCYLDLDQFKLVNDTCGHPAGDALLQHVAGILNSQVRVTDTLARLGGDEFAIILRQCSLELARRIANLMCQSIREFRFIWSGQSFSIGASVGLVEITSDSHDLTTILAAADAACYAAKEGGRNRIHVYRADDLTLRRQRNQQQWCLRIDKALEENRFQLYHQPIAGVNDTDDQYRHTELLIRMRDEQGQIVPPMAFIPAAERYYRMPKIDQWVIQTFLSQLSKAQANPEVLYNINLSGASLSDERFLQFLENQLLRSSVDSTKLCFEITETATISNLRRATALMDHLKQLGCQFALDDFGSGMSSFGYLKQLPVDYVKIDGSFVQQLDDPVNQSIVRSICDIGQAMQVKIIAERVENDTTAAQLKDLGVHYLQGYGIARPAPLSFI